MALSDRQLLDALSRTPFVDSAELALPGLYEYRWEGDNRVEEQNCKIVLNYDEDNATEVNLPYGELFTFSLFTYHKLVLFEGGCEGSLYHVGDSQ